MLLWYYLKKKTGEIMLVVWLVSNVLSHCRWLNNVENLNSLIIHCTQKTILIKQH